MKSAAPEFEPGFRLSIRDVIVLVVGIGSSIAFVKIAWQASLIIAFAIGHFFLFCNVFRISRSLEFMWAGIFVVLAGGTICADFPNWHATLVVSIVMTSLVILIEMRRPSYHGIFWQQINPRLKDWWDSNAVDKGPN